MSFKNFKFDPKVNAGIDACGYTIPTPIQKEAIPPILEGRDILGLAQTGTGKTAAFVLPLLQRLLDGPRKKVRALIIAPTRELAEQIHADISKMAKKTGLRSLSIYGGVGKHPQIRAIRNGVEIIVACPGRLLDLLNDKAVSLSTVEALVLDEADHMFDKGFLPDIRRIIKQLPTKRQSMVFSATMPNEIRHLAENILKNPAIVQINHPADPCNFPCPVSGCKRAEDLFTQEHHPRKGNEKYPGLHPYQTQSENPGPATAKGRLQRSLNSGQSLPAETAAGAERL